MTQATVGTTINKDLFPTHYEAVRGMNMSTNEGAIGLLVFVMSKASQHKDKNLWSDLGAGDKIQVYRFPDDQAEALFVANEILNTKKDGSKLSDNAILYRNNAQSLT